MMEFLTDFLPDISIWSYLLMGALIGVPIFIALLFRVVVPTNLVHIVQRGDSTVSYGGHNNEAGKTQQINNVYYAFPAWIPKFGVSVTVLPLSVFSIKIDNYEAYDLERLPFVVDLTAFFRITDSNLAAQRVSNFDNMQTQLIDIIQGSVRSILSSRNLNDILQVRSELGDDFTSAVKEQLRNWGIEPVKNIELMDIRDSGNSKVIHNIMEIKKSFIEKESRVEVARNQKEAKIAEIEAQKESDVKQQEAEKIVGLKTVENQREVAISKEEALQHVKEQEKITKEREMEVKRVEEERQAEITKNVAVIKAEETKQKGILEAEGLKQQAILEAEAKLEAARREAEGIQQVGAAEAEAKALFEKAQVAGQIELADTIASSIDYQNYLVAIRSYETKQAVGVEQAKALEKADMKFIINGEDATAGINRIGELITAKGGAALASFAEGFKNVSQEDIRNLVDVFKDKKE